MASLSKRARFAFPGENESDRSSCSSSSAGSDQNQDWDFFGASWLYDKRRNGNQELLRHLHAMYPRENYATQCKIAAIMALNGALGGQSCTVPWTTHPEEQQFFLIYNPSKTTGQEVPPDEATREASFPTASWFRRDNNPGPEVLWSRYELCIEAFDSYDVNVNVANDPCERCDGYCWRVAPHVQLGDFTSLPFLEALADFAKRDTTGAIELFERVGVSNIVDLCECDRCEMHRSAFMEVQSIEPDRVRVDSGEIDFPRDIAPEIPSAPPNDYDFVAERRAAGYRESMILRIMAEIKNWHTGNLGTVLCWLLEHHVDTARYSMEIDMAFKQLYMSGSASIALAFGMYASRNTVNSAIRHFHRTHAVPVPATGGDSAANCGGDACSCWAKCPSLGTKHAVRLLAYARDVQLKQCCPQSSMVAWDRATHAYVNTLMNACDSEILLENAVPDSPASKSWRRVLSSEGCTVLRGLMSEFDAPQEHAHVRAAFKRVKLLCDMLYVNECLRSPTSVFGGKCNLLGHCEPCVPPRREPYVPRKRALPDLTHSNYYYYNHADDSDSDASDSDSDIYDDGNDGGNDGGDDGGNDGGNDGVDRLVEISDDEDDRLSVRSCVSPVLNARSSVGPGRNSRRSTIPADHDTDVDEESNIDAETENGTDADAENDADADECCSVASMEINGHRITLDPGRNGGTYTIEVGDDGVPNVGFVERELTLTDPAQLARNVRHCTVCIVNGNRVLDGDNGDNGGNDDNGDNGNDGDNNDEDDGDNNDEDDDNRSIQSISSEDDGEDRQNMVERITDLRDSLCHAERRIANGEIAADSDGDTGRPNFANQITEYSSTVATFERLFGPEPSLAFDPPPTYDLPPSYEEAIAGTSRGTMSAVASTSRNMMPFVALTRL